MPPTIAILADIHLPDSRSSAQWAAFDWALAELRARKVDAVAVVGDVTASGSSAAATRARGCLDALSIPLATTPGNSDLRCPKGSGAVVEALSTPALIDLPRLRVLTADTSRARVASGERDRLDAQARCEGRAVVLVTHMAPTALDSGSEAWLHAWAARHRVSLIVAGHRHRDDVSATGATAIHQMRGLDPDKAIGGPPAIALLELDNDRWVRSGIAWPEGDASGWSNVERAEFQSLLGVSCIGDAVGGLGQAAGLRVRCVELRADAADLPRAALQEALTAWRAAGGDRLSWHMPGLGWEALHGDGDALGAWRATIDAALETQVDALTVHVPSVPVGMLKPGSHAWHGMADAFAQELRPATDSGAAIGIENMHMNAGEPAGDERGYGYLPEECLAWIEALRQRLPRAEVGMLLDIGHARNNAPFSEAYTLGEWYERVGGEAVGYHIHQVIETGNGYANHQPFEGVFGPLISLSSFLWAWRQRHLRRRPMTLEIRDPASRAASVEVIRRAMG